MKHDTLLKEASRIIEPYGIPKGDRFRLKDHDPGDTNGLKDKHAAEGLLEDSIACLSHFQEMLYAQDRWALLLIFQAMDAAGKDGAIKHVMSGVNPQGCDVHSFKSPSPEELTTTTCGASTNPFLNAAKSVSSTVLTTKKSSLSACIPRIFARKSFPTASSGSTSGRSATKISTPLSATSLATASSSASSFSTSPRKNKEGASSSASKTQKRTGSSPWLTSRSAAFGRIISRLMRK